MASTWSNYKIELIATGEQPGTWGDTTNNNFQFAIEQAIGGYATQALTTTSTTLNLTDTNALQNARALFLQFTGSPGAGATVVLPSIQKLYFIKNAITTYDLIVKTSTATTITVPNGKTACIYVNGTDVVGTSDWLPSLTTTTITASGTATLGGNLSVGGTSTGSTYSTYTKTSTTITVNGTGFPFSGADTVYISLTGGDAPSGVYTIDTSPAPTATAFTATPAFGSFPTGTTGGTVNSVTRYNNTTTIQTPFSSFGSVGTAGQVLVSQGAGIPPTWSTVTSVAGNWTVGGNLAVTGTSTFTGAATFNGDTTVGSTTVNSGSSTMTTSAGVSFTITGTSGNVYSLAAADVVYIVTVGGSVPTGFYTIASVTGTSPNVTAFTCNYSPATASAGTVTSVTKYNNTATLQAPLSSFGSVGTSGFVLTSQGTGAPPQWIAAPVTSVNGKTGAIQSVLTQYTSVTASALTINTTSGSPTITIASGTAQVGQILSSANLPAGTYITAVSGGNYTVSANATATASGTAATVIGFAFTGIPSWAKRITVSLNGPTGGAQNLGARVGTGATPTYVTTGYNGGANDGSGTTNATTYFPIARRGTPSAADNWSGAIQFINLSGNIWTESGVLSSSGGGNTCSSGGVVDAGAALTAIQISYANFSTTAFTGGTVNIMYE